MADDPDILVPLTSARTEFEGQTIVAALEFEGIPAKVFAASANMLQWEGGYTDPIKIMVRRRDLERAAQRLRAVRAESIDIDWNEVDVGQREELVGVELVCAQCGARREGDDPCFKCGDASPPVERALTVERRRERWARRAYLWRSGVILIIGATVTSFMIRGSQAPGVIAAIVLVTLILLIVANRPEAKDSNPRGTRR